MATTASIKVTEGSDKYSATYSFTEDGVTKHAQRLAFSDPLGNSINLLPSKYKYIAAGTGTGAVLGATGSVGDYLSSLLIIPSSTSPGAITLQDGNDTARTVFAGGASSLSNLVPFTISVGAKCIIGTTPGWKVTTGGSVAVIGFGDFT